MKNEKLMRAMGEIDEDLILEAHEVKKPRNRWVRWSALAACLALMMLCTPVLVLLFGAMGGAKEADMKAETDNECYYSAEDCGERVTALEGKADSAISAIEDIKEELAQAGLQDADEANKALLEQLEKLQEELAQNSEKLEEAAYHVGDTVRTDGVTLVYLSADDTSVSFHITKTTNDPLSVSVGVFGVDSTEDSWLASTDGEGCEYLSVTVNGEKASGLPGAAGAYDITVDLSALLQNDKWRVSEWIVIDGVCALTRNTGE